MPETATTEFWKELNPSARFSKWTPCRRSHTHNAPNGDERLFVLFTEMVSPKPLWISPGQKKNRRCDVLMSKRAGLVNRHYHPHEVFAYTISGKWGYLEHDWTATAGDFIYETPGEAHTLVAYEHKDPMKVFFVVQRPANLAG